MGLVFALDVIGLYAAFNINPSKAKATFVLSTRTLKPFKTMPALSCWYSLDSSRQALSFEYPFARVSVVYQDFVLFCIGQISHQHKG